ALTSPFQPYLCFSQRTGGVFSVTLSVNAHFRERCPRILRGMLPYGVRTFLQRIPPCGTRQRSAAIGGQFNTSGEERNRATDDTDKTHIKSKRRRDVHQKDCYHRMRYDQIGQYVVDVAE